MKTHLKVQLAGDYMNSNMKKPEEVEQLEPKKGMQKKGTLCALGYPPTVSFPGFGS